MATSVNNSPTPGPSFEGTPLGGSHAASVSYRERRAWIGEYFDRTAADAWKALTSDAPVSKVRATVRAGRDRMRTTLLTWLPPELHGKRVLDAGCGTGTASIELARRGAEVVAIDLSPTLVQHAQERAEEQGIDDIDFRAGDMLDPSLGQFDYVVAMDSIIHYELEDMVKALWWAPGSWNPGFTVRWPSICNTPRWVPMARGAADRYELALQEDAGWT